MNTIKPGFLTSEFWLHVLVTLAGLATSLGLVNSIPQPWGGLAGSVMALLSAGIYSFNRAQIKAAGFAAAQAFVDSLGKNSTVTITTPPVSVVNQAPIKN